MATQTMPPSVYPRLKGFHIYHAAAHLLGGRLEHPIEQKLLNYGEIVLENTRRESLLTQSIGETDIEGLISFKRGRTRVIGSQLDYKKNVYGEDRAGWWTQSTAALEGYNVTDVLTVDRVVAQVTSHHAAHYDGAPEPVNDVASISFLGSTFENLRIGGVPVEVELDLNLCAGRPANGQPHLDDESFLARIKRQFDDFKNEGGDDRETTGALERGYQALCDKEDAEAGTNGYPKRRCSLVKKIKLPVPIPGVKVFGNLLSISGFGVVALAEVEVGQEKPQHEVRRRINDSKPKDPGEPGTYFKLNMFKMYLGSPTVGSVNGPSTSANGKGGTGGGDGGNGH